MTPIHIIYALSVLLIVCSAVLVKCFFIIRYQDIETKQLNKQLEYSRTTLELFRFSQTRLLNQINELKDKIPKRNPKTGRFQ